MNVTRSIHATTRVLDEPGTFEAVVSAFAVVDSYGTRATRAFWEQAFARRSNPKICAGGHDWTRPMGSVLEREYLNPGDARLPEMARSGGGLLIRGRLNLDTDDGRNTYALLKAGDIDEWSFGAVDVAFERSEDDNVLDFVSGDVREFSPVLVGSNPGTGTISVRGENERLEDHAARVIGEIELLSARIEHVAEKRQKISETNRTRLDALRAGIDRLLIDPPAEARDAEGQTTTSSPVAAAPEAEEKRSALRRDMTRLLIDPANQK